MGSFTAMALTPLVMQVSVFWAFSIPGLFMALALGIFWAGRHLYILKEPGTAADKPAGFITVTGYALKQWFRRPPGQVRPLHYLSTFLST